MIRPLLSCDKDTDTDWLLYKACTGSAASASQRLFSETDSTQKMNIHCGSNLVEFVSGDNGEPQRVQLGH